MDTRPNPYVGPQTYSTEEAALFFGRDREATELARLTAIEQVVAFYGPAGCGKSSLIHTCLIPRLRQDGFVILPVGRVSGELPPGVSQATNLFVFNLLLSIDQGADPARLAAVSLGDFLAGLVHHDGRWIYASANVPSAPPSPGQLPWGYALIIDQFEEIFTVQPSRWAEREEFFAQLGQTLRDHPLFSVVLSLREDYVPKLDPWTHLLPGRLRTHYRLERLDTEAALEAISGPAAAFGRPFAPGVAEKLVDDLRRVNTSGLESTELGLYVEPSELQLACFQLWASLDTPAGTPITSPDLERLAGGAGLAEFVNDALRIYYEQSLAQVLAEHPGAITERALRRWFDQALITREGTRNFVFQSETDTGGMPNGVVAGLVDRFILRRETRSDRHRIELAHDRFVEPILRSNRDWFAREASPIRVAAEIWMAAGRDVAKLYTGSQLAAAETLLRSDPDAWQPLEREFVETGLREEQRRKLARSRKLRLLIAGAVVTLLVFAAVMTYLYLTASSAQRAAEDAKGKLEQSYAELITARDAAEKARREAEALKADAEALRADTEASTHEGEAARIAAPLLIEQASSLASQAIAKLEEAQAIARELSSVALHFAICHPQTFADLAAEAVADSCTAVATQASTIEPGLPVTGTIDNALSDPWKLEIAAASRVTITLSADQDSNLDPYLMLYDAKFKLIDENDDIEPGVIQDSALYDVVLTGPGLYWIAAGRCCPDDDQGSEGEYVLGVTVKEAK